jgi:hypothetical protein
MGLKGSPTDTPASLTWEQVLPLVVLQSILEHVVMPKLSATVESWDTCEEKVPIHVWVHPWLGMLEQRSGQLLCHSIRYKMSSTLEAWQVQYMINQLTLCSLHGKTSLVGDLERPGCALHRSETEYDAARVSD